MKTTRTKQAKHEIKETIENSKKTNQQGLKKVQLFMACTLLTSLVISISDPFLPKSITCLTSCYLISMISHGYSQFLHLLILLRPRWLAYVGIRKLLLTWPGFIIQVLCLQAALIHALICDIIVTPRSPSGHPFLFLLLLQLKEMPEMI